MASDKEKADKFVAKDVKFQHKVEKFQNKLDKNVMKSDKFDRKVQGKPKTIYTVQLSRDYDKSDERGYSFEEAINKSKRMGKANVLIKFQDKEYTQTEFACLCGCTKYWIYAMRKNGYTADEMYEKTKKFRLESEVN